MGIYNCPANNGTSYSPDLTKRYTFQILCETDFYGKDINGKAVVDVQNVLATSIDVEQFNTIKESEHTTMPF